MVVGDIKPELVHVHQESMDYRGLIGAINQSMLKVYDDDPVDFYNQFVLKQEKKEDDSFATLVGSLAEFYLLECHCNDTVFEQNMDRDFAHFTGKIGSGQMYELADRVFSELVPAIKQNGGFTTDEFIQAMDKGFSQLQAMDKFKGKAVGYAFDNFEVKDKSGGSPSDYFEFKVKSFGKKVIDDIVIAKAKEVATMLKTDDFTCTLFNFEEDENSFTQRFVKFPIVWNYKDVLCKSELDQFWINQIDGWAVIDDLKCVYDNEAFDYSYIKRKYYLQNGFYYNAARWWMDENGMKDIELIPGVRFIVGDTSKNKRRPLLYPTSQKDLDRAQNGFTLRGNYYKGVHQLMDEVKWSMDTGIFNISRDNYNNKGVVQLNIKYE